ncbi:hypothetical protein XP1511_00195 [Xanthomonas perforans]|uniref:Uncharacterized protein n=1 Tax=Xanthomonas perforans TaxID=442694 RepID=A0ABR5EM75_XANPE|nr:hypothetical protein XP315_21150 [Xanthomonas perforans]KLC11167.1 hypothetical protein XP4B_13565 [Xanthomonas perforans]KLC15443.1 hypothetical protein XP56_16650 [Xanthomonas perforans]KLC36701.1 hypothetical protein XP112_10720 [Xanthomonas perforans]KLC40074.1 hypothetical protein XP95_00705 [Xanthomonas perforans]
MTLGWLFQQQGLVFYCTSYLFSGFKVTHSEDKTGSSCWPDPFQNIDMSLSKHLEPFELSIIQRLKTTAARHKAKIGKEQCGYRQKCKAHHPVDVRR